MVERAPKTDHVTFAFVGGGFAGLVTGARLKSRPASTTCASSTRRGDFGGTWYWNRYPGAQCDTASFVYMPLLEETGHMPTEKYAHAPGDPRALPADRRSSYGLYDNALFHTEVTGLAWDETRDRWRVRTNRGDEFTAHFIGLGTGPLHVPKLPGHPGHRELQGPLVPHQPLGLRLHRRRRRAARRWTGSADKRVGDHRHRRDRRAVRPAPGARRCGELYVFQRTPSSVDVRGNRPIDPDWFAGIATPGWQQRWLENFTANQTGRDRPSEDLVQDGWTDLARRIRAQILGARRPASSPPERMLAAFEDVGLREDGGDPRAGRRHRRRPRHRREA